jgi:NitT/TauT family transport system permease protein
VRVAGLPAPLAALLGALTSAAVIVVIAVLVIWTAVAALLAGTGDRLAPLKLPFPHSVLGAFVNNLPLIAEAVWETARGAFIGLLLGVAVGTAIGVAMAQWRVLEDAAYPYLVAAQMIPTIALAPIVLAIMKDPYATKVAVAAYISVFAVSLGTIKGLRSTPPDGLELMHTLHARPIEVLVKLRVPAALPYFFAGLRIAAPLAVIGEIVVELAGSKDGLGTLLLVTQYYGGVANAHLFWAVMLVTLLLGYVFARSVTTIERLVAPWQPEFRRR